MLSSAISFLMLHVLLFMLHLLMKDIVNLKSNFNKLLLKGLSFENELQNILTSIFVWPLLSTTFWYDRRYFNACNIFVHVSILPDIILAWVNIREACQAKIYTISTCWIKQIQVYWTWSIYLHTNAYTCILKFIKTLTFLWFGAKPSILFFLHFFHQDLMKDYLYFNRFLR